MPSFAMLKVDNKLKITFPFFSQTEIAVVLVVVVVKKGNSSAVKLKSECDRPRGRESKEARRGISSGPRNTF